MTMRSSVLTSQQEQFAIKFVATGNEYLSYKESFAGGATMKDSNIRKAAQRLLQSAKIAARIEQLRDKLVDVTGYGAVDVINHLKQIALADPNELMSYRRHNCRHCKGRDHLYQWIDAQEHAVACAEVFDFNARCKSEKAKKKVPSDDGGYGFHKHGDPNPHCPRCFGQGVESLHIADTRKLSAGAKKLYAGVKKTKDGIEVKTHDQTWALGLLAKHFRVVGPDTVTNVNVGVTNISDAAVVPMDAQEAAKFYQNIMQGKK